VAAHWWGNQLRHGAKLDNGATDPANMMVRLVGEAMRRRHPEEQISRFETILARNIDRLPDQGFGKSFGVDYHPDDILGAAAVEAGLSLGMTDLPWKTRMVIAKGVVTVSSGYGAVAETLYDASARSGRNTPDRGELE